MEGRCSPLDKIQPLCAKHGALLVVDDAHGTGVLGHTGAGTAEHFGLESEVPILMGTFSKALASVGGFLAADKEIIDFFKYFARPFIFSASLPPTVVAAVLAGFEVIRKEPERRKRVLANARYLADGLRLLGFSVDPDAAIVPIPVSPGMSMRKAARRFHDAGIFINALEYPVVALNQQRFRAGIMATHTTQDLDRLLETVKDVFSDASMYENGEVEIVRRAA